MRTRGFILQPTYRIESGRAVIHLFGVLESGGGFLVRDGRERPHFFVRDRDAERAAGLGAAPLAPTDRTDLAGEPVRRVEVALPADAPRLRERLQEHGVPCLEADVRYATRYLIDRGIRGTVSIDGEGRPVDGIGMVFEAPELQPADWSPRLSTLSFDIETDPEARRLLSIALHGCGAAEVHLLTGANQEAPEGAIPHPDQRALLRAFVERVRELDPDVLTGWNVIDFDLQVLERLSRQHGVPLHLGRGPGPMRLRRNRGGPWASSQASIPGRVVLDGIALLRGAFVKIEEYGLDFVARKILGVGKTLHGPGRADEILQMFRDDRRRLVEYNLTDARLVTEILEKLRLVELSVERSRLTGMPPDRVAASIASFDFLYLTQLGRRGVVAPTVGAGGDSDVTQSGGHVLEPEPGLYDNVLTFDFKSLYPSLIRTFQIDPMGYLQQPGPDDDPIVAPNGAALRREPGILPKLLDDLFPRREAAKARGDEVASQAIKILMNSFYGVLGTPACRFFNPALANAITSFGRVILLWSKERIEAAGHRVLYGDTDSLFVLSGADTAAAAQRLGVDLVTRLNRELHDHIASEWRVESRLELQFERVYLRLMLPPVRHGTAGARKRYAGLVADGRERKVVFTGMEAVRRDWTPLAREVQAELYRRLFLDEPVEEFLRDVVAHLRAGLLDDRIIYKKALRKKLDEYTATTPPHVAAARKMSTPPGRLISYVMTTGGPEPAAERNSPIDHEHYVQKQVRPVAEPVLGVLDLEFDRAVGDEHQLDLF